MHRPCSKDELHAATLVAVSLLTGIEFGLTAGLKRAVASVLSTLKCDVWMDVDADERTELERLLLSE